MQFLPRSELIPDYYFDRHDLMLCIRHIGRGWLERLLGELTYLSSLDQDASILTKAQISVFSSSEHSAITSSIEDLLFHRLRKEWGVRCELSQLLEQIQLSQALGNKIAPLSV